ncbi:glycosyltransferase [Pseudomonas sp. NPDC087639]|uniref:glycosyltransferase n=1 Tax=Pseudomonas sp. NPDC087639 TaxID=3364445 RepID=UPI0038100FFF
MNLRADEQSEPLNTYGATSPVRVFVAATPAEWLPMRVLEFSIRERTSLPVELSAIYSHKREIPQPKGMENRARTPFSFQRFLIPELCQFNGRAIYMDADMQVFEDIEGLWNQPFSDNDLLTVASGGEGRRPQFSVMVLDCERLNWRIEDIVSDLDSGKLEYRTLMFEMTVAQKIGYSVPVIWNSLEHFREGETALLHYTDMNTQPWVSLENKNGHVWMACLRRAVASGFISRDELVREIRQRHVRPTLLTQLDSGEDQAGKLSVVAVMRDLFFVAPYHALGKKILGRLRTRTLYYLRLCRYIIAKFESKSQ